MTADADPVLGYVLGLITSRVDAFRADDAPGLVGAVVLGVGLLLLIAMLVRWFVSDVRHRRGRKGREHALRDRETTAALAGADAELGGDDHLAPDAVEAAVAASDAGTVRSRVVGMVNREGIERDRVVVRVETARADELWTLEREGEGWRRLAVESSGEADHHLATPLVARPDADVEGLRDLATVEMAAGEGLGTVPESFAGLEVGADVQRALLDLSVLDGRFAPAVVEATVRRAVTAWAEAVDGDGAPFRTAAEPAAVSELLTGGDVEGKTRLVVRGPQVLDVAPKALDLAGPSPRLTVDVTIRAARFRERIAGDGPVMSIRDGRPSTFTDRWSLGLDSRPELAWRLLRVRRGVPALRR